MFQASRTGPLDYPGGWQRLGAETENLPQILAIPSFLEIKESVGRGIFMKRIEGAVFF
jgi:hypothetical protein